MTEPKNLWGGRFSGEADPGFVEFNRSFGFDRRLFAADVRASVAHCAGLLGAGVLSRDEATAITSALLTILERAGADAKYFAEPASGGCAQTAEHDAPGIGCFSWHVLSDRSRSNGA